MSLRTLIRLEKGDESVKLSGELLRRLADALQLTTGERKEFFLAATGIDNTKIALDRYKPTDVLEGMLQILRNLFLPAFILDSYYDIIAVNYPIVNLYDFSLSEVRRIIDESSNFNSLRFFFSPEFEKQQKMMGASWERNAWQNMMGFRAYSLQYRTTPYFVKLLEELRKYRLFNHYWNAVYWWPELSSKLPNDYIRHEGRFHDFQSPEGPLEFVAFSYVSLTTEGYLMLGTYVPTSPSTHRAFDKIAQRSGTGLLRLGSWPKNR